MKEVKNKDKNRRSCCERYVANFIVGNMTTDFLVDKMKVNPQLTPLIEKVLNDKKKELVNIPMEMWDGKLDDCVDAILNINIRYGHIAKYLNAISKGRIRFMLYSEVKEYGGKPVVFSVEDDIVSADFTEDNIVIKSAKHKVVEFIIY